jgi:hypothetical protein
MFSRRNNDPSWASTPLLTCSNDAHPNNIVTIETAKCRSQHVERYWHLQSAFIGRARYVEGGGFFSFDLISCCEVRAGCGTTRNLRPCPWLAGRTKRYNQ